LANNHVLDYGAENLLEMLGLLDGHDIAWTGAGRDLAEALRPALLTSAGTATGSADGLTVAVLGITDNEPEWEAGEQRPGVNHVKYDTQGLREPYLGRMTLALCGARQHADLVIVSAHVGPNWGGPSPAMQALARQLIDLGADLYWGHSCHTTLGIELYRDRPILYATGDFLDDYAVDPGQRNDLSFVFRVYVEHGSIRELRLHPVHIGLLQVNRANAEDAAWIRQWMRNRCRPFGTTLRDEDDTLVVSVTTAAYPASVA
jgi:poly-gamma-glutamate capsule biosynthesis protein CapA/YwtB (metallophosphatase superfamily)